MRILKKSLLIVLLLIAGAALNPLRSQPARSRARSRKVSSTAGAVRLPGVALNAMKVISAERISQHVRFLSHDLLEGRGTGQRGGDIAAQYIATQFALYGLKPAGDNGSYFQKVPLVGLTAQPETSFGIVRGGTDWKLKPGDEYVATDETQKPSSDIDAEVVFAGYGITAPEFNWDDYKDVDVHGKAVMLVTNEPPSDDPKFFGGKALTYYGRWTYKYEEAARRGAVAVLLVHKTGLDPYGWEVVRNSWSGEQSRLRDDGQPHLKAAARIHLEVAKKIAELSGQNFDDWLKKITARDFHPITLPLRLKAHMVTRLRPFESSNVIAEAPGSDRNLRDEAVIYTAHYDHLGIHPEQPGDNIYNGAMDNGTGCGILLEIAHAYAESPQKPRRSMLFASVTAEEQGLLGSQYLGEHPPVPAGKIALDLNFDDVPARGVPQETEVVGAERTTLYPMIQSTARDFRLAIVPDSRPEEGHYYRSDHFSLARVGVPSFSVNEGMKYQGHTREWGLAQDEDYTAHHYHQPSDEWNPNLDFRGDAVIARFGFALGWKAASLPALPQWNPGDEFEAARKKSEGQ